MIKKHINIPIFIPELACPFQCIYCNQRKISGQFKVPKPKEINRIIDEYLSTVFTYGTDVEVAFFGGSFTGLDLKDQEKYLKQVQPYIANGRISGIRVSTRPDYINSEILALLKAYHVRTLELGAQSMDDNVLKLSKRGHTAEDTVNASSLISEAGFSLGLQMMIGLPGDTLEKSVFTANEIIRLGADNTRIYPALVIRETKLEELYYQKKYMPLTLDEAVHWTQKLLKIFNAGNVTVLRIGLHPSEGLLSGKDLVAGPFHPSFRELVLTEIWSELFQPLTKLSGKRIEINVAPDQVNYAVGYHGKNKKSLYKYYNNIRFNADPDLTKMEFTFTCND